MSGEETARSHIRRLAIFVGVGVTNTAIDIAAFACFYRFAGLDAISSNVLAFLIAVTNSYVLNRFITFADRPGGGDPVRRFVRFLIIAAAALTVSTAIVYVFAGFTHPMIGKLVATVASTFINYFGSHRLVFPRAARGGAAGMTFRGRTWT